MFKADGSKLSKGTSYVLPANSTNCVSVAFSPESSSATYAATANKDTNNVSVFPLFGSLGTGDGDDLPLGAIIGTTVGVPVGFAVLTAAAVTAGLLYRYVQLHQRRGSVNFDGQVPSGEL